MRELSREMNTQDLFELVGFALRDLRSDLQLKLIYC